MDMVVATIVKIELITILASGAVVLLLGLVETVKDFWRDEDDI